MTTNQKIAKVYDINHSLLQTLTNTFSFDDAMLVYLWKWTLLDVLTAWANEIHQLDIVEGNHTTVPPAK
jgi:hypothetical protein